MKADGSLPRLAIVIPMMDRSDDLRSSLPNLLSQDYPQYEVYIIDHCSLDGLEAVLEQMEHPRLKLIRCPRPDYFSFSKGRNIGARYTFSDLLFFLNGDNQFRDTKHLSQIIDGFLNETKVDSQWYRSWRSTAGYRPLEIDHGVSIRTRFRRVYSHCLGSPLLVEREVFQKLGGYNEALQDWGYEDTDLIARLELAGFGRINISGMIQPEHPDDKRTINFREKDKRKSWKRNCKVSDTFIRQFGPILPNQIYPGRCEWIEIEGIRYNGALLSQQEWCAA